jgi:hypothetical protein
VGGRLEYEIWKWKMEMQNENGKYTMKSVQQPRAKCQRQGMSFFNTNLIFCTT